MSIRKQSAIRHLSYEELDLLVRNLAEQIKVKGIRVVGIQPKSVEDVVPSYLLANFLQVPYGNGSVFSLYSDYVSDFCLFKLIYDSDHYNKDIKAHVEEIEVENDHSYQKVTMPWRK